MINSAMRCRVNKTDYSRKENKTKTHLSLWRVDKSVSVTLVNHSRYSHKWLELSNKHNCIWWVASVGDSFREVVIGFVCLCGFAVTLLPAWKARAWLAERILQSPELVKCHVIFHLPKGSAVAAASATSPLHPVPQQQAVRMDGGIQPGGTAFFRGKSFVEWNRGR